ncbi:MAG TPA: uroporphyrinogen decarboxylase family protein [bacterium]|nr:uroporphyrinogen decarboxylase family protein [bacterium]HOM26174.1 uroporphyrinogen decarboxylase family protein [bacterium]
MEHIEIVKRAIEFKNPDYLPMELVDVPKIYNAYGTLNPDKVRFIPGTEDFDSAWVTYHWTFIEEKNLGNGEILRKDEWNVWQKIPFDKNSTYIIIENPLADKNNLSDYKFPSPEIADKFFERISKIIKENYSDRFICGYIDPGAFLIAYNIFGYQTFFIKLVEDINFILDVISYIFEYHCSLIPKWKKAGAHMVNIIDEIAGNKGLFFNPQIWQKYFRPFYEKLFRKIHQENMYTGLLFDGDIRIILDDLLNMEIDVFQFVQPNVVGIKTIKEKIKGKRCIKCSVDMMSTLAHGTPEDIKREAEELVKNLNSPSGGFICNVLRWYRPTYPEKNVIASVETFNKYRKNEKKRF